MEKGYNYYFSDFENVLILLDISCCIWFDVGIYNIKLFMIYKNIG